MPNTQKKTASLYSAFKEVINPQKLKPATQTITNGDMNNIILQINEMMRKIYNKAFGKLKVSIKEGGTGADNAPDALLNLGIEIPADEINNLPQELQNVSKAIDEARYKADNAVEKSGDTMTGDLTVPKLLIKQDGYVEPLKIFNAAGQVRTFFTVSDNDQFAIRTCKSGFSADAYRLPEPGENSTAGWHNILTTKSAVTVGQGGTGANNAAKAAQNLLALFLGDASTAGEIAKNTNLNNLAPGTYRSKGSEISSTLTNAPTTSSGFRLVVSYLTTTSSYIQVAVGYSTDVNIYVRVKTSSWGAWKKIAFA